MLQAAPPLFQSFAIGDITLTQFSDGTVEHRPSQAYFGTNVSASAFAEFSQLHGVSTDGFAFPATVSFVEADGERILIDAGHGPLGTPDAGLLLEAMGQADIDPASVTHVLISHLHGDHIGGLLTETGEPVFARARHWVSPLEMAYWQGPARALPAAKVAARLMDALGLMLTPIAPGDALVRGVSIVDSAGHTPGHLSVLVESQGQKLLIASDLANHPVWSIMRPRWHMSLDVDGVIAASTRTRLLGRVADERMGFAGYHMPFPAVGRIHREGDGFRYEPGLP